MGHLAIALALAVSTSTPAADYRDLFRQCVQTLEVCTVHADQLELELQHVPTSTVAYTPGAPRVKGAPVGALLVSGAVGIILGLVGGVVLTTVLP